MKKEIIEIIIKVIIYALTLIGSAVGIYSLTSCKSSYDFRHSGTGYFQYYDTLNTEGTKSFIYEYYRSK